MVSKHDLIVRAKLAEQAERYKDMAEAMKAAAEMGTELSNDERNMLSIAHKNVVGSIRTSWRVISSIEQTLEGEEPWKYEKTQLYREKLQTELEGICGEVTALVDNVLMRSASTIEAKVFYMKMKADYFRYRAEVVGDPDRRRKIVSTADKIYKEAIEIAGDNLKAANPIRLGLALNYSVFLYEVKSASKKACKFAKEAFDGALEELDTFREESYEDSTIIMQLLRDNVKVWSTVEGKTIDLLPKDS